MATVLSRWEGSKIAAVFTEANRHAGPLITIACLFIGLVSAYDAYLTMVHAPYLVHLETNPIGRELMRLDGNMFFELKRVAQFLGLKFAGTVCAMSAIHLLFHFRRRWAAPVAVSLALFQVLLLLHLQYS